MRKKFKFNYDTKFLNTNGSIFYCASLVKSKLIEFNIDFISHNAWKKNIDMLEKQQQITNFKLRFSSYK